MLTLRFQTKKQENKQTNNKNKQTKTAPFVLADLEWKQ